MNRNQLQLGKAVASDSVSLDDLISVFFNWMEFWPHRLFNIIFTLDNAFYVLKKEKFLNFHFQKQNTSWNMEKLDWQRKIELTYFFMI